MSMKKYLQRLQKTLPNPWLEQMQYWHSTLLLRWILTQKSQPTTFTHKSAIVFSPHQDDETFGCGGMIAIKREYGIPVAVAFITDGRGSGDIDANQIIQIRKEEAVTALRILGVESSAIHFLEKPDGSLSELTNADKQQTISQIVELLQKYQPEEVYVPHYKDCHRDHEATHELVKAAIMQAKISVELIQYPIWLFWRSPIFLMLKLPDIAAAYHLSITPVQHKKQQAISSYCSQIESLPSGFIQRFLGSTEIFFKSES